ncbi:MAG: hypothetical protein LBV74_10645 [Tannerella sp.]|jgi:chitinase|nr:hypothetical protein [Tannerella sp.]
MKNLILLSLILLFLSCSDQENKHQPDKIVLAYVTGGNRPLPDPSYMTHIYFAFGHVNKTFDGIFIPRKERLKEIVALKKTIHP